MDNAGLVISDVIAHLVAEAWPHSFTQEKHLEWLQKAEFTLQTPVK